VLVIILQVEDMRKKTVKKSILSPKASINGENPSSLDTKEDFEGASSVLSESMLKQHLREIRKDYKFLKDEPLEMRKEEAIQPLYITRYE
jgi:hypothetical protein